jgi:hypothetical protein
MQNDNTQTKEPDGMKDLDLLCAILSGNARQVDWSGLSPADWQTFVTAAHQHGVAPLLYHTLEHTGWPEAIPESVRHTMRLSFYQTTATNTLLYKELASILAALQTAHIPVVVLKGAALAKTLYPHIGLRPMMDIDLLVQPQHRETAIQTLHDLGYSEAIPEMTPGFYKRYHHHYVPLQGGLNKSIVIELHWQLVARDQRWRSPPLDWFWQHTEPWHELSQPASTSHAGAGAVRCFTPTANLSYLAAHLVLQHGGMQAPLLWLYDLHLLVSHCTDDIDWNELIEQTNTFRWNAILHTALQRARLLLGTPLPRHVSDTLAALYDQNDWHIVQLLEQHSSRRLVTFWHKVAAFHWTERFWFIASYLMPSPGYIRWQYRACTEKSLLSCYLYHWRILAQYVLLGGLRIARQIVHHRRLPAL